MTELLIRVLLKGLTLWEDKESNKYIDKVVKLRERYIEEYNKPRHLRSNVNLDEIQEELEMLSSFFAPPELISKK